MEADKSAQRKRKRKRHASVYDAVAGRTATAGFKPSLELLEEDPGKFWAREKVHTLYPDEVLFRGANMPARYAEDDLYEYDRHIPNDFELPDSALLEAIHAYAADFNDRQFPMDCTSSWRSMDETALLAMGYLLEEAAMQVLGKTGDLALVEGEISTEDYCGVDKINGYTYNDLPSVKQTQRKRAYPREVLREKLGFMRFGHSHDIAASD